MQVHGFVCRSIQYISVYTYTNEYVSICTYVFYTHIRV